MFFIWFYRLRQMTHISKGPDMAFWATAQWPRNLQTPRKGILSILRHRAIAAKSLKAPIWHFEPPSNDRALCKGQEMAFWTLWDTAQWLRNLQKTRNGILSHQTMTAQSLNPQIWLFEPTRNHRAISKGPDMAFWATAQLPGKHQRPRSGLLSILRHRAMTRQWSCNI